MTRFILLFLIVCLAFPLISQDNLSDKWMLHVDFSVQKHDKRLYHWPKFPREALLARQPGNYETYQLGINVSKEVFNYKRFSVFAGVGLGVELATFLRPFNHLYRQDGGSYILLYTDRYYQNLLQLPIKSKYTFLRAWNFTLDLLPQFNFLTVANHSTDEFSYSPYSWWQFNFYSIEINPGIEYSTSRFNFGMKYRVFQFKKVDPILFYSTSVYTVEETFETYNPFKLWVSIGYKF